MVNQHSLEEAASSVSSVIQVCWIGLIICQLCCSCPGCPLLAASVIALSVVQIVLNLLLPFAQVLYVGDLSGSSHQNPPAPNMMKPPIQQVQALQRNSNLRELPVAPASVSAAAASPLPTSMPAAQIRPTARRLPPPGKMEVPRTPDRTVLQKVKPEPPVVQPGPSQTVKSEVSCSALA